VYWRDRVFPIRATGDPVANEPTLRGWGTTRMHLVNYTLALQSLRMKAAFVKPYSRSDVLATKSLRHVELLRPLLPGQVASKDAKQWREAAVKCCGRARLSFGRPMRQADSRQEAAKHCAV